MREIENIYFQASESERNTNPLYSLIVFTSDVLVKLKLVIAGLCGNVWEFLIKYEPPLNALAFDRVSAVFESEFHWNI